MATQWWLAFHALLVNSAARFAPANGTFGSDATENNVKQLIAAPGNLKTFKINLSAAPGSGKSYRFQVSINASASTTLDVTISDAATSGLATGMVAVNAGDLITVKVTPSGSPATGSAQYAIEFDPTTAGDFTYPATYAGSRSVAAANAPGFAPAFVTADDTAANLATASNGRISVAPFAGTIKAIYVDLQTTPGAGKSWDFILEVNNVEVGSALNLTGTTGNQTGLAIAIAAGDKVAFKIKAANGTPASTIIRYAVVFHPTVAGNFLWSGTTTAAPNTGSVRYLRDSGQGVGSSILSGTEADVQATCPATLFANALYVVITTAPGASKSWTFASRIAGAAGKLSAAISGGISTTANDTATNHRDRLTAGQLINLSITPASTPAASGGLAWSLALQKGNNAPLIPPGKNKPPGAAGTAAVLSQGDEEMADRNPGDTIDLYFTTADASGAPTTLIGSPVVSVYKDNDNTSEVITGVTLTVDFDGKTGLNQVRIVTSDGFYAAAHDYNLVITTGTVGGVSVVGYVIGSFSLQNRNFLRPTTAGRTLDVSTDGDAEANVTKIAGTAVTATAGIPEVKVASIANNALTAAAINADAITNAKIADDAIAVENIKDGALTTAKFADGAITAAKFAAGALDAVWSTATRLLTAGTNIVLAKGVGLTGLNDIAASAIINDATPFPGADIALIKVKTDLIPASPAAVGDAMTLTVAYDLAKTAAQASDIPTADITAIKTKTDNLPTDPADESNIIAAISALNDLSLSDIQTMVIEGTLTFEQVQRILLAFAAGITSGFVAGVPSSAVFKDPSGGSNRMTGDLDANGNRSNVVLTP